jgi:hypothetical protein
VVGRVMDEVWCFCDGGVLFFELLENLSFLPAGIYVLDGEWVEPTHYTCCCSPDMEPGWTHAVCEQPYRVCRSPRTCDSMVQRISRGYIGCSLFLFFIFPFVVHVVHRTDCGCIRAAPPKHKHVSAASSTGGVHGLCACIQTAPQKR